MWIEDEIPAKLRFGYLFHKGGKNIKIDSLSTGEKQIVFRGTQLLRNIQSVKEVLVLVVYSPNNDNPLVFDKAIAANPGATPLFHSDRGYQYTSKAFRQRILDAGMTQSMSRVARCIDNGPMEGFWGIMKREMYYGKKYRTKEALISAIENYMDYYTNKRVQRNLGVLTPMEFHEQKLKKVA